MLVIRYFCLAAIALSTSVFAVDNIQILALFKGKAVIKIDDEQVTLSVGQTSQGNIKLISATSEKAILEIDGKRKTFLGGEMVSIGTSFAKPIKRDVRISPDVGGMYRVRGAIDGYSVHFLVDTGATLVAMNANIARRMGIDFKLSGRPAYAKTASGVEKAYAIKLSKVKVGSIEMYNVDAMVIDSDYPEIVLLGNSFLNRLEMKREGRVLTLRKKQ